MPYIFTNANRGEPESDLTAGNRRTAFSACLLHCLIVGGANLAAQTVPVQGDSNLLELVRAAQVTNRSLFPEGELTATVHSDLNGYVVDLTATVVWQGERVYRRYQSVRVRGDAPAQVQNGENIDSGNLRIWHLPEKKFLELDWGNAITLTEEMKLCPNQTMQLEVL